ncbi:methylthioribose kinase [Bacillus infantis]|uniref:DUF7147 family protein n=1 Tax=Bacillus infantis TaxID=324767 RepID=UPI00101D8E8E|nr:methylthioribose kinase [Bacillus infantis]RYI32249.1 methylthioribose kinase [Bacillus infantis]
MIQRFIELGEGYSDIYELLEIVRSNKHRLQHLIAFQSAYEGKEMTSVSAVLRPAETGKFQPLYICREGIPHPDKAPNARFQLFKDLADDCEKEMIRLEVKPSALFAEKELFYQYLIGILRLNHYIQPLH